MINAGHGNALLFQNRKSDQSRPEFMSENSGFIQLHQPDSSLFRAELSAALLAPAASTAAKYFYDALGSKLFEAICELPEYYPTRTESAIFAQHLAAIADAVGRGTTLIDLGAGNCAKAARLFSALQPGQYVPVDISVDFLRDAVGLLQQRFPRVAMLGLGMDFSTALELPGAVRTEKRLFFYPGSSIGNFHPEQALVFLRQLRAACTVDGGLLIGVDLVKEHSLLNAAYDDALGVTAAFNLNVLLHLNRVLGSDFVLADWRHVAFFNVDESRVEMHLEARRRLTVSWPGAERRFAEGERIHTENSYKYTDHSFKVLLEQAGFALVQSWTDERDWFMVCHAHAA
jgi:dimethylhistidine N-methyltransferase